MKIYAKNFIIKNLIPKNLNLLKNITNYKDIYSAEGIFRIQNDNIFKLIPQDIPCEYMNYKDLNLIVDKSSFIFKKISSIPYNHVVYNIEQVEYKFYNNSPISFLIEYNNNKIIDYYFFTKQNLYINFEDNILEYISLFNNIKQS
jgi:hypothetical protein